MATVFISLAYVVIFIAVAASGIVSLYSAVNALADTNNLTVFASGAILLAASAGPLFAYAAGFGFVYDLGLPVGKAIVVTAPYLIAWCVAAVRTLATYLRTPWPDRPSPSKIN